jgi:ATP-dependent DNA helicase RecG
VEESQSGQTLLGLDELLVLNTLWQERSLSTQQVARLMQKSEHHARAVLERLVEIGLLEARGERKGRTYHLSAATYRRLGVPSAYVRQRGFEPIQQEQMIQQYLEAHGRITRREVAELCRISPYQATRLLRKMVEEGKLSAHGVRKSTWYELRS